MRLLTIAGAEAAGNRARDPGGAQSSRSGCSATISSTLAIPGTAALLSGEVNKMLIALNEREREILRLRFEEDLTQAEVGQRMGVSQMQISRILHRSLEQLRQELEPAP